MRRRDVIAGALGAAAIGGASAQQPGRTYRIALLTPNPIDPVKNPLFKVFFDESQRNGFAEGHNLVVDKGA